MMRKNGDERTPKRISLQSQWARNGQVVEQTKKRKKKEGFIFFKIFQEDVASGIYASGLTAGSRRRLAAAAAASAAAPNSSSISSSISASPSASRSPSRVSTEGSRGLERPEPGDSYVLEKDVGGGMASRAAFAGGGYGSVASLAELLQEFGFTAWTGYSLLAIICLFISTGIFFLTLCVLLYHNAVKTAWQQKKTKVKTDIQNYNLPNAIQNIMETETQGLTAGCLMNICWLEITTRGIIMNNAASLPARIFLAGDNIPLYLLKPNNVALLLTEFGLPLDSLITAAVASYVFYVAALVFVITTGVLMYHNVYKMEWQRPYKEHLYVC
ncbi:hypothetical protein M408DRAFT_11602 [Serendipita vermifera MAFF 305830]|uniref:Uncharacterized protein n=1 Tax=Serendipita vermifera MAFF 305830 TaxID=933852 RepID=A0A0C3AF84_SERVB|nr:hypothetical protein M408DRAFT_11602 [Serendipita vermifera MAFF 305830]